MDPHLIRTFDAVARLGSFSAAAGELGYTQSAVSQQIAALESDLGVGLLQRRPVALTEAGARLLEHAGPLLLRLAAARADVRRAAGSPAEHLTLGANPLAAPLLARAHGSLRVTVQRRWRHGGAATWRTRHGEGDTAKATRRRRHGEGDTIEPTADANLMRDRQRTRA